MNADIPVWTQSLVAVLIVSSVSLPGSLWLVIRSDFLQGTALALNFFSGLIALVGAVATLWLPPLESIGDMAILLVLE
jgi:hypothetical protein